MPDEYWRLTPAETEVLLRGHYIRDIQMSALVASFINAHRDPTKGTPLRPEDAAVFQRKRASESKEQSAEEQRQILEVITVIMGGEVVKDG